MIAYEPVWAIGTGKAAYPDDASRVIGQSIRPVLADLFGNEIAAGDPGAVWRFGQTGERSRISLVRRMWTGLWSAAPA